AGVQPAGHRQAADQRDFGARLCRHPGRRRRLRNVRRPDQPADGPALHRYRSEDPGGVMSILGQDSATRAQLPLIGDSGAFAGIRRFLFGRLSTAAAAIVIAIFVVVAVLAPWLAPYDPLNQSIVQLNRPPSWDHWLGTDQFGRDVLSRIIFGSRNSLIFGI